MAFLGFVIAICLFHHFTHRLRRQRQSRRVEGGKETMGPSCVSWQEEWHRQWAEKFERQAQRRARQLERHWGSRSRRRDRRRDVDEGVAATVDAATAGAAAAAAAAGRIGAIALGAAEAKPQPGTGGGVESETVRRARRRAAAETGFYIHFISYLGVMALLALINVLTTPGYPWFLWPAMGWGIGVLSHYMAVFGSRAVRERYFDRAVERELRRERVTMHTEKQASIDELSSSIAHEIRNPIAAAKSLVQQMGEDPHSVENVEYAKVALTELERV